MSEADEDFATLFEASEQAKRIEKGQTIDGLIVAIGPEVALVSVGGKSEAVIEIDELRMTRASSLSRSATAFKRWWCPPAVG